MADLSKEGYLEHLVDIRDKLNDFIELIDQGKLGYFKDISLKLRILYLKKSGTAPLLDTIEDLFDFEMTVWNSYSISEAIENGELPSTFPKPSMEMHNGPLMWFGDMGKKKDKIKLIDAFKREKMTLINGHYFSVKRIVEVVADKMGGAHIDKKVDDIDLLPHSIQILLGNLNLANRIVYDVTRQTIKAIDLILEFIEKGYETEFIKKKN